jgi:hypothetical protein
VQRLEQRLPHDATVFQLPVTDFPEHGAGHRMSDHDLIKETYLHSSTLRWSAGGIRGRSTEWQWPASRRTVHSLLRGLVAMGFSGLMLDRYGYSPEQARHEVHAIHHWLGPAQISEDHRLLAWDLRRAGPALMAGLDATGRARLARRMLDAPRLYLDADASPLTDRGDSHPVCRDARLQLQNPARRAVRTTLVLALMRGHSDATGGTVRIGGRRVPIAPDAETRIPVTLPHGITRAPIQVQVPGIRCDNVEHDDLPTIAAHLATRSG